LGASSVGIQGFLSKNASPIKISRDSTSIRGTSPKKECVAVGQYFEFVNRTAALDWLWELVTAYIDTPVIDQKQLEQVKQGHKTRVQRPVNAEPSRLPGGGFIVLVGASGIGKSTMVTDGLVKLLSRYEEVHIEEDNNSARGKTEEKGLKYHALLKLDIQLEVVPDPESIER